jgi:hypothetical protein
VSPHNGERSCTGAQSSICTMDVLPVGAGFRCVPVRVGGTLGGDTLAFTLVDLAERLANPYREFRRQRASSTKHLAEMGRVQSHPWSQFIDDYLTSGDLGAQITC